MIIVKGVCGFLLGFAIWWGLTPYYNELLRRSVEPIVRFSESPPATVLKTKGREVLLVRSDLPGVNRPGLPVYDLTFNIILLTLLFAINPRTFGDRNVMGFLPALVLLYAGHVFGLLAYIHHILSTDPEQGRVNEYTALSRAMWHRAIYFYRTVGALALAVGIWWLLRPEEPAGERGKAPARPRKKA